MLFILIDLEYNLILFLIQLICINEEPKLFLIIDF